ncbi:cyclin B1 interacting protein-like protein 1 [Xylariaceae sp. FL0016]|nr:cyclin B1 interacting protein-like protein 1 [Xylariaceae sp. FL0016]
MECASRALNFWAYQATQEIFYHEHVGKTLSDKHSSLNVHLGKIVNEANAEITDLRQKLTSMDMDQENLRKKNEELALAFKDKNKKLLQTQELYDKLKRKAMLGQMQDAAEHAVDSQLHHTSLHGGIGPEDEPSNDMSLHDHGTPFSRQYVAPYGHQRDINLYQPRNSVVSDTGGWLRTIGAQANIPITPSTHRQRVGETSGIGLSTIPGLVVGTPAEARTNKQMLPRDFATGTFRNSTRFPPAGLSSGSKVGHNTGGNESLNPSYSKPRAAQRPTPMTSVFSRKPTTAQPESLLGGIRSGFAA